MRKRSARMRSRIFEPSASLEPIFNMIRALGGSAKGFNMEEYYCSFGDSSLKGVMPKKNFAKMLQSLIPLSDKELALVFETYCADGKVVDTMTFFNDAGLTIFQDTGDGVRQSADDYSVGSHVDTKVTSSSTTALHRVKQYIEQSLKASNKSANHLYKLFSSCK